MITLIGKLSLFTDEVLLWEAAGHTLRSSSEYTPTSIEKSKFLSGACRVYATIVGLNVLDFTISSTTESVEP